MVLNQLCLTERKCKGMRTELAEVNRDNEGRKFRAVLCKKPL